LTFSIVACDKEHHDLGVAVASKFVAVGSVVPYAKAGAGAVATQAWANVSFGPRGLELLERGEEAKDVLEILLGEDVQREDRQVGIVDSLGGVASHTGQKCFEYAGHLEGEGFCCQGNIITGREVLDAMSGAFQGSNGELVDRLLKALEAGQRAGGDKRGQQSAALFVVRSNGGYMHLSDRYVDLRVDDHPKPIEELKRVFRIYDLTLLSRDLAKDVVSIDEKVSAKLQEMLSKLGYYKGAVSGNYDDRTRGALERFMHLNNLENKIRKDGMLWGSIYRYIEELAETST
jgi:uncharacterized Ntn-hydrolase superfamily protein